MREAPLFSEVLFFKKKTERTFTPHSFLDPYLFQLFQSIGERRDVSSV